MRSSSTPTMTWVDVLVIGAGPSGLATAKALKDLGCVPPPSVVAASSEPAEGDSAPPKNTALVVESKACVGGVWRPDGSGLAWSGLCTNLSSEKCALSDVAHRVGTPDFPSAEHMGAYFTRYAEELGLLPFIHFQTPVISVQPVERGRGYDVRLGTSQGSFERVSSVRAGFVVVASGCFATPCIPSEFAALVAAPTEELRVRHAAGLRIDEYNSCESGERDGKRRRVLVVGSAYTGADLAVALATHTDAEVSVVVRTKRYLLPRFVVPSLESSGGDQARLQPWDRVMETRSEAGEQQPWYENRMTHEARHKLLRRICVDQSTLPSSLRVDPDRDASQVVITDGFAEAVAAGKITIVDSVPSVERPAGDVPDPVAAGLVAEGYTDVILCTGYRCNLDFLNRESILDACEPEMSSDFLPLILYKSTLHPTRDDIAFVGIYRGPYLATLDVQARWVAAVAMGRVARPSNERLGAGLDAERRIRRTRGAAPDEAEHLKHLPQTFPHQNYVAFTDHIAAEFGAAPTLAEFPSLKDKNVVATHYRLRQDRSNGPLPLSDRQVQGLLGL